MRYWEIAYPGENDEAIVEVLSDTDILLQFKPHWYSKMCEKFGKDHVDANYSDEDCIMDWVVVHWAVELKQCPWDIWRPSKEF